MSIFERLFGGHHGSRSHHGGGHHDGRRENYGGGNYTDRPAQPIGNVSAVCPNCNASNASGAKFCQQCGISLVPSPCKQCNASLAPGAKFCSRCGTAVA